MTLLLPAHYRAKALFTALAGLAGFMVASAEGLINLYRIILPGRTMPDGAYPYPSNFWQINSMLESGSVCLIALGVLGLFLAREPDEFYYKIRLESMQYAVFVQFFVMLASFCYFYFTPGYEMINTFQGILGLGFSSFLVTYVLRYYYVIFFQADQH
ncbi:hypothetical protein [Dyadobacter sp. MSC1_007]|jgi:hypothetical protein|uniref:hypothetical protein n=1 Tax=Dyadobacter sp. MSC1_007 TaxID=2909264 RepID=UPI002030E73C|nr:hypothetical protein [Dyadobacter sp. MSC1_007]